MYELISRDLTRDYDKVRVISGPVFMSQEVKKE